MRSANHSYDDVLVRLERLEKRARRAKILFFSLVLAGSLTLLSGVDDPRASGKLSNKLVSEEITIVDSKGNSVLKMGAENGSGRIELRSESGSCIASLGTGTKGTGTLSLLDPTSEARITLHIEDSGSPQLVFQGRNAEPRIIVGILNDGMPYMRFGNNKSSGAMSYKGFASGGQALTFSDKHGKRRLVLETSGESGLAGLRILGEDGKRVLFEVP